MRATAAAAVLALVACTSQTSPTSSSSSSTTSATSSSSTTTSLPAASSTAPNPGTATTAPSGGSGELVSCWSAPAQGGGPGGWEDVTSDLGLVEPLTGIYLHAAAWGDVDGDSRPDLAVGTFGDRAVERYQERGADGPRPDQLLYSGDPYRAVPLDEELGRTSGALFADLDGDGDLDLVLVRNAGLRNQSPLPSQVFENRNGSLQAAAQLPLPAGFQGRSVAAIDLEGDGRLDLAVAEDLYGETGTRVLANRGELRFEDVTAAVGVGDGVFGLGVVAADLSGDGTTDLFVAGDNRIFVGDGNGSLLPAPSASLRWEVSDAEDLVGAAAVGDVNGDGLLDLVVGHHFGRASSADPIPVRLYLNQGIDGAGMPRFEDVTEEAGLVGLPTKAPHVELVDVDNDGLLDLLTSASADDGALPAVFRQTGREGGRPRFAPPEGLGASQYWVTAPTADVDRDGRLDVFLGEWEPSLPSRLLRNTSASGHWLQVAVAGPGRGVGSTVRAYREGALGDPGALVGHSEILAGVGYTSGGEPVAHLGLGELTGVDLEVGLPDGSRLQAKGVAADQRLGVGGC